MDMQNIILDVDGTLWDTTDLVAASWTRALRTCKIEDVTVTGAMLRQLFGKTMDVIAQAILPEYPKEKQEQVMKVCCEMCIRDREKAIPYPTKKKSYRSMQSGMDFYIRSSLSTTVYLGQPLKEQTLSVCSL